MKNSTLVVAFLCVTTCRPKWEFPELITAAAGRDGGIEQAPTAVDGSLLLQHLQG